jgi:hypothetical protein
VSVLFMSPKGGNCTTVTASALALLSALNGRNTLLIDLCGDVPATLGMAEPTRPGMNDWLAEHNSSDAPSMVLLGEPVIDGLVVVHRGSKFVEGQPRWHQLAEAISSLPHNVIIDAGTGFIPTEIAQRVTAVTMVTKPCYLSLRRATTMPRPHNVVVVREEGRALTVSDVGNVLNVPVIAEVPHSPAIARAVDAGLLPARVEQLFGAHFSSLLAP